MYLYRGYFVFFVKFWKIFFIRIGEKVFIKIKIKEGMWD